MEKKHEFNDEAALAQFVQEGYVLYQNVFDPELVSASRQFFMDKFNQLKKLSDEGKIDVDVNGWAVAIMKLFERTDFYEKIIHSKRFIDMMKRYVGPDVALLGYDALWINVPKDKDPVLLKGQHTDAWSGTGVNTVFAKIFFTDVDPYNGMSVSP